MMNSQETPKSCLTVVKPKVVNLVGAIDAESSQQVLQALKAAIDAAPESVFIHAAKVDKIDSNGVAVLSHALHLAQAQNCRLVICAPSPAVRMVLELSRLDQGIEIMEELAEVDTIAA